MDKHVKKQGRRMSLLLRHRPEEEHLDIDRFGWVACKQLISRLKISMNDLHEIVAENNKSRFAFNHNETKIRAVQGHSIPVDLGLKPVKPLDILFHGTATKNLTSIFKDGINKGTRNHLHLSADTKTATDVGSRHGNVVLLSINAKQMHEDGIDFYISENGVWLVDFVPAHYIINRDFQ